MKGKVVASSRAVNVGSDESPKSFREALVDIVSTPVAFLTNVRFGFGMRSISFVAKDQSSLL